MKAKLLVIFFIAIFYLDIKAQNDTITQIRQKNKFISLNAGYGLGWRNNKFPSDKVILYSYPAIFNSNDDLISNSMSLLINYGFENLKWRFGIGFNYGSLTYKNKSAKAWLSQEEGTVKYRHKYFAVPISMIYSFGSSSRWKAGTELSISVLMQNYIDGKLSTNVTKLEFKPIEPFLFACGKIGHSIYENNKLTINLFLSGQYSSAIGSAVRHDGQGVQEFYDLRTHHLISFQLHTEFLFKL